MIFSLVLSSHKWHYSWSCLQQEWLDCKARIHQYSDALFTLQNAVSSLRCKSPIVPDPILINNLDGLASLCHSAKPVYTCSSFITMTSPICVRTLAWRALRFNLFLAATSLGSPKSLIALRCQLSAMPIIIIHDDQQVLTRERFCYVFSAGNLSTIKFCIIHTSFSNAHVVSKSRRRHIQIANSCFHTKITASQHNLFYCMSLPRVSYPTTVLYHIKHVWAVTIISVCYQLSA